MMDRSGMFSRSVRVFAVALLFTAPAVAQEIQIEPGGTVVFPQTTFPPSTYFSEAGVNSAIEHIETERSLKGLPTEEFNSALFGPRLERTRAAFPVRIEATEIGGVPVLVYEPEGGVAPESRDRLIINLHGGGFVGCFVECGGLESIPLASMTGLRVVSVDYRVYPQVTFPAATDDVEAVYRALLEEYPASQMAIYGCSAGGWLTAQALARFHAVGLPQPAAAAILCSGGGLGWGGDSRITGIILGDGETPRTPDGDQPGGYMKTARPDDPTANPVNHPETLAAFPPTLIGVGTRDFAMSSAIQLHRMLVLQGVDTRLHVWDGGRHAFYYDIRVPESLEMFSVLSRFLTDHLNDEPPAS
ncbi:alpha/beta hydrolase [Hyphomonas sp.]|uniref:alpha/beta hydrolase n=1 Tax=Hyphomonas sp. TaxID=87 RepID=UPI0025B8A02B|nr:alpha/beta hydrolase [Hyphomonas sp.]